MQTCNQLHVSIHMGTVHSFIKLQLNSDHKSSTSRQQQNIEYLNQVHSGRYQTHLNSYSNRVHPFKSNINLSEIISWFASYLLLCSQIQKRIFQKIQTWWVCCVVCLPLEDRLQVFLSHWVHSRSQVMCRPGPEFLLFFKAMSLNSLVANQRVPVRKVVDLSGFIQLLVSMCQGQLEA